MILGAEKILLNSGVLTNTGENLYFNEQAIGTTTLIGGSGINISGNNPFTINTYVGQSTGFHQTNVVTMTIPGRFYDAISGNIGSGTWLVVGHVLIASTTNAAMRAVTKLWDGVTTYGSYEISVGAMGAGISGHINFAAAEIIRFTGISNPLAFAVASTLANTTIRPAPMNFFTGITNATATDIDCVRIA